MLRVVGSSLKLVKFEPTAPNMSQHIATRWPNARNMWHPTMLRYVVLACCDRLAGALYTESKYHINHFVLIAYGNLLRKSRTKHRSRLLKYMLNTLLNTFSYLNCGKIVNNKQTTHPKSQKLQQPLFVLPILEPRVLWLCGYRSDLPCHVGGHKLYRSTQPFAKNCVLPNL